MICVRSEIGCYDVRFRLHLKSCILFLWCQSSLCLSFLHASNKFYENYSLSLKVHLLCIYGAIAVVYLAESNVFMKYCVDFFDHYDDATV